MFFFTSQIYRRQFFTSPIFMLTNLMLLNLNTARALTEMKQKLLHCIFFRQDFQSRKLISIRLREALTYLLYLSLSNTPT